MHPLLDQMKPEINLILKKTKLKQLKNIFTSFKSRLTLSYIVCILIIIILQVLILLIVSKCPKTFVFFTQLKKGVPILHTQNCINGFIYVYELPPEFNKALLNECENWNPWVSRCNAISNDGLGARATGLASIVPKNLVSSWYWTDMFAGEVIYHTRIMNYKCTTLKPDLATAFYVPFYAGLAIEGYLFKNYTPKERDMQSETLLKWIQDQPYYTRSNGSDHFVMVGRMTWDFRRTKDEDWGSSFINMPGMKNITRLSVEQDPWDPLEVSVPYPTGFHPKSDSELQEWQHFVQSRNRASLYTFVGGKRKMKNDFRALLHDHCFNNSDSCRAVDCSKTKCHDGASVILEAFLDSDFCLQPRGDAYTRRSMFDCMLAGSIPVFFWKRSIYHQYEWFLNDDPGSFSVFIDKKEVQEDESVIRRMLERYSREDIERMRDKVIGLIPRFVYAMPGNEKDISIDAFDIAMEGVLKKFKEQKAINQWAEYDHLDDTFSQNVLL